MFKFITKLFLFGSSYLAPLGDGVDANGWVSLAKPEAKSIDKHESDHDDPSIWVLFSKQLDKENFMARFPVDPKYRMISPGEMEMTAEAGDGFYSLRVLKAVLKEDVETQVKEIFLQPDIVLAEVSRNDDNTWNVVYRKEGKWISQTFILSPQHLYIFQTEDTVFHRENHQKFASSLDLAISKN